MHNTRRKSPSISLATVWGVPTVWMMSIMWMMSTVTPVTSQTVTHDRALQMQEASQMSSLLCPVQYRPRCVGQPSEAPLPTPGQPVTQTGAVRRPQSEKTISVALRVPEALGRALLTEGGTIGGSIELRVPEALPMILAIEDWDQMP